MELKMIIKPSASLRNEYLNISNLAKQTQEPIYITKNGEGDLVVMDIDAFEKREQALSLRERVLFGETERLNGAETLDVKNARKELKDRLNEI